MHFDCPIVGGDTGSWDGKLAMSVAILGRSAGIQPITRKGARPGDAILVTGPLGGSLLRRHIDFIPRIHAARRLAATGKITAMIDISDGLSRDLLHICQESGVGATIDASRVPIHADAATLSAKDGRPPLDHALHDGEDHELLFTAAPGRYDGCIEIGTIRQGEGILLNLDGNLTPLPVQAWEHRL